MIVATNIILIPRLGIIGSAIASLISVSIIRFGSMLIIGFKSKLWPFGIQHLKVIIIVALLLLINSYMPIVNNIYVDMIYRSTFCLALFLVLIHYFKIYQNLSKKIIQFWLKEK